MFFVLVGVPALFAFAALEGSDIKAAHSLEQQGCPSREEGRDGRSVLPLFPAVPADALWGRAGGTVAPGRRPRNRQWAASCLQRVVPPVTSTRTLQFPIEGSFQGVLTGVADRVMKDKFHNAKGRGADNEIRELTPDPSQHFLFSPSPSLFLSQFTVSGLLIIWNSLNCDPEPIIALAFPLPSNDCLENGPNNVEKMLISIEKRG